MSSPAAISVGDAARKLAVFVVPAVAVTVPALVVRFGGLHAAPVVGVLVFGAAIMAAGFMLSWGAETAEQDVSRGLVIAVLALITVLPEYVVDLYFAFQAGRDPAGPYVGYATANMTGANRMLIGVAWPAIVLVHWARGGGRSVRLERGNAAEIAFLAVATVYSFVIYAKGSLTLLDTIVLVAIFAAYLVRQGRTELAERGGPEADIGPAAVLLRLPNAPQWTAIAALALYGAAVILVSGEPFAESLIAAGAVLGIDQFLLIQWLAPLASEAPAVIVAVLFALRLRSTRALGTLVSDKINQWTLLVGMIPILFIVGAGRVLDFPLSDRQREEFFLTAAQSVFAVAVTLRLELTVRAAAALFTLFSFQFALGLVFRDDPARTVTVLIAVGWLYLMLSAIMFAIRRRELAWLLGVGLVDRHEPGGPHGR